jgi:capsular exopolysaccharide synthesis family protein
MDLKNYISILWGNKWIIITTLVITLIVVIVGTMMITPIYSASATLRVATSSTSSGSYTDYVTADRLMNTYTKIATSSPVLAELASKLNLQIRPDVKVTTISSTELIQILVKSPNPQVAQMAANTLADILIAQSQQLYSGGEKSTTEILSEQLNIAETELNKARTDYETLAAKSPGDTEGIAAASLVADLKQKTYETLLDQYETARVREAMRANIITIIEPAVLPLKPSQPNKIMNIALGFIVGLAGGIGLVFLFENLNPKLRTMDQIETVTEMDIIEKIPSIKQKGLQGLFNRSINYNDHAFTGSFQRLQTRISQQNTNEHPIKSIVFTSAVPGEGKSTIVSNLALAIGRAGQRVIIVDCDMRIPTQHKIFGLPNKIGLSTLLTHQSKFVDVIQKNRNPNTWILTSGPTVSNAMELLGLPQMKSVIDLLVQKFDYVLLDTPALLPVGDVLALNILVDGIILVTRQAFCKEDDLREAYKQLADYNGKFIGVVVNDVNRTRSYYYNKNKNSQ